MKLKHRLQTLAISVIGLFVPSADALCQVAEEDSCMVEPSAVTATELPQTDTVVVEHKRNIIQKVIDYFGQTNAVKPDKKFDVSVIGGPSYSEATSLEIAALVSGQALIG